LAVGREPMPSPPTYTGFHSLLVVLLHAFATATPIFAEPLDCPGGYQLEFIWDQIPKVGEPSITPGLMLVAFSCGVVALLIHAVRFMRLTWTPLWLLVAALLLHLLGRTLFVDWGLLYRRKEKRREKGQIFTFYNFLAVVECPWVEWAVNGAIWSR